MKLTINKIFFLLLVFLSFNEAYSQLPPPPPPTVPPGTPIDNGVLILFFIAIILGFYVIKKIYSKKSTL